MGNIGDSFTVSVPSVGSLGTAYASTINDILDELMARTSVKVPVSSIATADAALDMANQGLQNASYLGLYEQSGAPSGAPFGRFVRYAGNVYWVDAYGAVQITVGSSLNAGALGGIVGDYGGSNPAKLVFTDSTETYEFYDDLSLSEWALIKSRGLDLVDESSGNVTEIRRATGGTSYTLTLPNTPPAAIALLAMTTGGIIQRAGAGTIGQAFSMSADITLTGNAHIKHGTRTLRLAAFPENVVAGSLLYNQHSAAAGTAPSQFRYNVYLPPVATGMTITFTRVYARIVRGATAGTAAVSLIGYTEPSVIVVGGDTETGVSGSYDLSAVVSQAANVLVAFAVDVTLPGVNDKVVAVEVDITVT